MHPSLILWKYDRQWNAERLSMLQRGAGARGWPGGSLPISPLHYTGLVSFRPTTRTSILVFMESIAGIDAIRMMQEVSKLPDGRFTIAFYKYNRTTGEVSTKLQVRKGCKVRAQLPQEAFRIPSDNYFLFEDEDGNPKTCYRVLIRFVGFPPEYKLTKVNWFKDA